MLVLGLDPGYGITGWGAVECGPTPRSQGFGVIRTDKDLPLYKRLAVLYTETAALLERFQPGLVAIEKLYFSRNVTTAEGVFEARGVILAACGQADVRVLEVSPLVVKQAVTGSGKARKGDVNLMVRRQLNISGPISPDDAADGLAIALTGCAAGSGVLNLDAPGGLP